MAFTYDKDNLSSARSQVRLLIRDVDAASHLFSDAEVDAFLALEGQAVRPAAAAALETVAADEVLVQKRITLLDLRTDGPAEAAELRALAARLREQHAAAAGGGTATTDRPASFAVAAGGRGR